MAANEEGSHARRTRTCRAATRAPWRRRAAPVQLGRHRRCARIGPISIALAQGPDELLAQAGRAECEQVAGLVEKPLLVRSGRCIRAPDAVLPSIAAATAVVIVDRGRGGTKTWRPIHRILGRTLALLLAGARIAARQPCCATARRRHGTSAPSARGGIRYLPPTRPTPRSQKSVPSLPLCWFSLARSPGNHNLENSRGDET